MKYRKFTVEPGLNGFKVKIGCAEVYFSNKEDLLKGISDYLFDPIKTENIMLSGDMRCGSILIEGCGIEAQPERSAPALRETAIRDDGEITLRRGHRPDFLP